VVEHLARLYELVHDPLRPQGLARLKERYE
jgi:hypothetical protein